MTAEEYKEWISKNFNLSLFQKKLFKFVDLGKVLIKKKSHHFIESSFNSQDQLGLLKVEHIFNTAGGKIHGGIFSEIFDLNLLIKWIGRINKNHKLNFPLSILEFLCSIPIFFNSSQKNNFPVVLSGDFERFSGKFNKFSIFFKPVDVLNLKKIIDFLKIPEKVNCKEFNEILFLGIDLCKNNTHIFKIYKKIDWHKQNYIQRCRLMKSIVCNLDIDEILLAKKSILIAKEKNIYI